MAGLPDRTIMTASVADAGAAAKRREAIERAWSSRKR